VIIARIEETVFDCFVDSLIPPFNQSLLRIPETYFDVRAVALDAQ